MGNESKDHPYKTIFFCFSKDKKVNYAVDGVKDRDIYLEHVRNEGQDREDDDVSDIHNKKSSIDFNCRKKVMMKKKMKIFKV